MKMFSRLMMIALLALTLGLFGCGDDGKDGVDGVDGEDFSLPANTEAGLVACATCHGNSPAAEEWLSSKHGGNNHAAGATSGSCADCHNPSGAFLDMAAAFGVSPDGTVIGCEDCHGAGSNHVNLPNQEAVAYPAPDTAVCGQCHDGEGDEAHLPYHPFNGQITSRFLAGPHGGEQLSDDPNHARDGFCSACHSHEGALAFFNLGGADDVLDLAENFNPDTVPSYAKTEEELVLRECATCHDPHSGKLRTEDTLDDDGDTVFSAEFNLCTTCHMVDLDATAEDGLYSYELSSDSYSAANMVDAATGTFDEVGFDIFEPDGSIRSDRTVYNTQVFYHDNTPGGGRSFVDTHFAGTVVGRVAAVDETDPADAVADVEVVGYNINAAAADACTTCHDPHSANKVQGDDLDVAVAAGEGVGTFHADYTASSMGYAVRDSCLPCHSGGEGFVAWTVGGSFPDEADSTPYIACRTCHQLEQFDATAEEMLGDPTAVREFPADHVFAFPDGEGDPSAGVEVVEDLGVNQICFECHKGRVGVKPTADTTTQAYSVAYLHYAASYATLLGDGYNMIPTYEGKTYAGAFAHYDGTEFGCADCHNVHNSQDNKMFASTDCTGCHSTGATFDAAVLEARTETFGERLRDTIIAEFNSRGLSIDDPTTEAEGDMISVIDDEIFDFIATERNEDTEIGANDLAKATAIYTIFNYHDGYFTGADGEEHGHGASWAHNSRLARQVQYDAIEALGGDLTGLTRP